MSEQNIQYGKTKTSDAEAALSAKQREHEERMRIATTEVNEAFARSVNAKADDICKILDSLEYQARHLHSSALEGQAVKIVVDAMSRKLLGAMYKGAEAEMFSKLDRNLLEDFVRELDQVQKELDKAKDFVEKLKAATGNTIGVFGESSG